jgi:hypothetical protein
MRDLDLPRGDERELVVDRDRVYDRDGETALRWLPSERFASCRNTISIFRTTPFRASRIRGWSNWLTPLFKYLATSESADERVVSRVGIEPTTRRLRVCCSAN